MSGEASRTEFEKRTGGFIAPVAEMVYGGNGQCVATFPHGGLTVLDQFAIAAMSELIRDGVLLNADIAHEAYALAQDMLAKKREIEGT